MQFSKELAMKNTLRTLMATLALAASSQAMAEIVVIVNPANPASRMFSEQASQFFLGKSEMFTPVDMADNAIRNEFYQKLAGKDSSQVKAIWSKLVFTGKGTAPVEYGSAAEVKKAIAANPKAIGYIDKSAVDSSVKVILTLP
jgi:ABC-type phosphate transport system substrate-binding protein